MEVQGNITLKEDEEDGKVPSQPTKQQRAAAATAKST